MSDPTIRPWPPLTEAEREFISFWDKERDKRSKWTYALIHNLARGIIFGAPIALFFFIEAPRHRGLISHGDLILIMVGIFLTAVFYALFRGSTKWDQYESHYQILKMKEKGRPAAGTALREKKEV